jgi:enamine deaminase RidA (YjgF/YER057c/UK114 family)
MEECMPDAPDSAPAANAGARLQKLGLVLPAPPMPLGAYVEVNQVGSLLFLSGTLPIVNGQLAFAGRLGANLSVVQGQEAARLAALNALALVHHHAGGLHRVRRLAKLTVLMVTTEQFTEHAAVGDGASNLFAQLFGPETGHVRVVCGVPSMPIGAPVMVETIFEVR